MKNKECMNCGSTKFHQVENGWKCDYCGTLYLNPQKETQTNKSSGQPAPSKKRKRVMISLVIAILFIIGPLSYLSVKSNNANTTSYEPIKPGTNNSATKDYPGEWTQEIYDSIKVATEKYDADSEKYSFEGGSSYEELEKLVGKPDTVTSWEKENYGMPPRAMAPWNKNKDGDYAGNSISITYEKKTMMITDKNH